ncbi:MAG: hypothetical protein AB8C95_10340 [Phycisphaeraceae bacterium]
MPRPTRIIMFGVFCLIFAVIIGINSLSQTIVSIAGPQNLEKAISMMESMGQGLTETQQKDLQIQINVMRNPVYRVGQGLESFASSIMALMLIVAGVGLLASRTWALKLTKWWSYYAIPAAAISVVLTTRYLLPEMPEATSGRGMLYAGFMLIALWAFPVMLLRQLPTKQVKAYLAWRDRQRYAPTSSPMSSTTQLDASSHSATTNANTPNQTQATPSLPARPTTPAPRPAQPTMRPIDNTWRDDPWNDPSSK